VIVVDASAVLEPPLQSPAAAGIEQRLLQEALPLHAPHVIDLEATQVLRRYAATGQIEAARCRQALDALRDFSLRRYPRDVLLGRVWELRHNLTAYVAFAEALNATLLTRDRRRAAAPGHHARIELP
jgi:predicted nucleic acid-binding protein